MLPARPAASESVFSEEEAATRYGNGREGGDEPDQPEIGGVAYEGNRVGGRHKYLAIGNRAGLRRAGAWSSAALGYDCAPS